MRGRKPGQGKFSGGRPKDAPNKKGKFETSLPPVRCSEALKAYYEDKARAAGIDLSTYLREVLARTMNDCEQAFAGDFDGAGQVSGVSGKAEAAPSRA